MLLPVAAWCYISSLNQHQSTTRTVGGGLVNNREEISLLPVLPLPRRLFFFCLLPLALAVAGCPLTSLPQRASSVSVSPSLSATSKDLIPGCDTSPTLSQPVPSITFK